MTVQEAYKQLSLSLQTIYELREAASMAAIVIEHLTGFSNTSRIVHKNDVFTRGQQEKFHQIALDLLSHKPVQYVLHEAYFYRMKLYVDERVLIPRPETEELIEWIVSDVQFAMPDMPCTMLDAGTGSGCMAIAVKKNVPWVNMYATDVSDEALQVAKRNAKEQQTEIHFSGSDILDKQQWQAFPKLDYIISNPPYIAQQEATSMNKNVLNHEPHLALFVPDNNPLLFYEAIGLFGLQHLNNSGKLFFEINESYGNEVVQLLSAKGYINIEMRQDSGGKNRMVKAEKTATNL